MTRNRILFTFMAVILTLLAVSSAQAENDYEGWRFRVFAGAVGRFVESDDVTFDDSFFGTSSTEVDGTGFGYGIDFERRFNKLFGLDLAIGYTTLEVQFRQSLNSDVSEADLDVLPIWLAANFHVVNTEKLDFWVGPQIAYVSWNDPLNYKFSGVTTYTQKTEAEFPAIGFVLGLDWWLTERGGLNFAFRFVDADADSSHDLPVDPTFVTLGYTWKF